MKKKLVPLFKGGNNSCEIPPKSGMYFFIINLFIHFPVNFNRKRWKIQ